MPPRRAADVLHDLFCRFLHRPGFLSHLRSLKGYDEPEILPSSTRRICLIGADAGHSLTILVVDRLDSRPIHGQLLASIEVEPPAKQHERTEHIPTGTAGGSS